jgi:hypothetical protein
MGNTLMLSAIVGLTIGTLLGIFGMLYAIYREVMDEVRYRQYMRHRWPVSKEWIKPNNPEWEKDSG